MGTRFWDAGDLDLLLQLFGLTLRSTQLNELAALLRRPACSLRVWREDSGGSAVDIDASKLFKHVQSPAMVRTLASRLKRTRRLRERSRERRPFPTDSDLDIGFEPTSTTFVLYRAPVAYSRYEEDWSIIGAVCPEQHRAIAVISNNSYFSNMPDESSKLTEVQFIDQHGIELGPFRLVLRMISMITEKDAAEIERHAANIYDIERRLRLFVPDDFSLSASGIEVDFHFVTTKLSSAISRLSFHQMRLDSNLKAAQTLNKQVRPLLKSLNHQPSQMAFSKEARELEANIANWITDVNFNLDIARTQLQVVCAVKERACIRILTCAGIHHDLTT